MRSNYLDRKRSIGELLIVLVLLVTMLAILFIYSNITEETQNPMPSSRSNSSFSSQLCPSSLHCEQRTRRLPQAIIIGSRKSGTRALLKFLELNLAIKAAHSEVHFFDKPQNYKLGYDWYRSQMPESYSYEVTIEKSPAYFVTSDVAQKVKAMNSSIKLILILRDPVVRLISDFSQIVANRIDSPDYEDDSGGDYGRIGEHLDEPITSINIKSSSNASKSFWDEAEADFVDYVLRSDGGIDEQRRAVKIGMYSIHLERWRASFPMNQFHFVDGENLINNPFDELHKLELFLGLKPVIRREDFVFNIKKGFFCLVSNVSSVQVSKDDSNLDEFGNNKASLQVEQNKFDHSVPNCLSKSKGRRHVQVQNELLEKLRKFYEPYNEYLYSLVGHNFNWSSVKM